MKWLPCILLIVQIPFYVLAFEYHAAYTSTGYAQIANMIFQDSAIFYVAFIYYNKDWNTANKTAIGMLIGQWLFNLYACIFGCSWAFYSVPSVTIMIIVWIACATAAVCSLPHKRKK